MAQPTLTPTFLHLSVPLLTGRGWERAQLEVSVKVWHPSTVLPGRTGRADLRVRSGPACEVRGHHGCGQMASEMELLRSRLCDAGCYVRESLVGLAGQGREKTRQGCDFRQGPMKGGFTGILWGALECEV